MTIEQCADDAAAQHALIRFVFEAWFPLGDDLIAIRKTANVQTLRISRATTETRKVRGESLLDTFRHLN